jgi:SNF2 family DNA or RNA helicase
VSKEIHLQVLQLNRTPVFKVSALGVFGFKYSDVFGATLLKDGHYYFPAYYPLHTRVLADLQAKAKGNGATVVLSDAAQKHFEAMDVYGENVKNNVLPPGFEFKTKPFQHQLDGLVHLIWNLRAALFFDCGLGKTKIVIDWQRAVGAWPIIVCPRIAMHVWPNELKIHGINQQYQVIDGETPQKKQAQILEAKNFDGVVMTYDTMKRYYAQIIEHVPYTAIVADESHKLKGYESMRTQVATEVGKKAFRRVIMSGTPSLGDPKDLPPQFRFLAEYVMPWTKTDFARKFYIRSVHDMRIVTGYKNMDIINRRANSLSIRRRKEDCVDLPERTIIDIPIKLQGKARQLYNTLVTQVQQYGDIESLVAQLVNDQLVLPKGVIDIPHPAVLISKLLQVSSGFILKKEHTNNPCDQCAHVHNCVMAEPPIRPWTKRCAAWHHPDETERKAEQARMGPPPETFAERLGVNSKEEPCLELLEELLRDEGHKVIIWGQFIEELNIIEDLVQKALPQGHTYVRVDGRSMDHIQEFEKKFNEDPTCRVYVGQIATAVAITLNVAKYMVYYSLSWNLEHYKQSIDRNYRIGQTQTTTVYRLLTDGVERYVAKSLTAKDQIANSLVAKQELEEHTVARTITKVHEL